MRFFLGCGLWAGVLWSSLAWGQLPVSQLTSVFPPGGRQGDTFKVEVAGQDLEDLSGLHFSHEGIQARPAEGRNTFEVVIAKEVPPGIYETRVEGRFGLSNPRAFAVDQLDEIVESGSNRSPAQAQEIPLGSILNGRADGTAVDHFKFRALQGQRVLIEPQAEALDSRMKPVVALFDEKGHEWTRNRHGGLLDQTIAADGFYFLRVHDFLYNGGNDYFYRLKVHAGPHIDFIFPPAGRPGETRKFRVYGRNLPQQSPVAETEIPEGNPRALEVMEVEITLPEESAFRRLPGRVSTLTPAGLALRFHDWRASPNGNPAGAAEPLRIGLATAPVIEEAEPNDEPGQAQRVTLPCEVAGQFFPSRDRDWVEFEAAAGEVVWVEVISERLGLPTDPFVLLQRVVPRNEGEPNVSDIKELYDEDANLGGREFNTQTRDPSWRFEIKEAGLYRLLVRDLFDYTEPNPAFVYRLSLRRASPDFQMVARPQDPQPIKKGSRVIIPWPLFLRQGETWPVEVLAFRRDGFNEPIHVTLEGHPEWLHSETAVIESGQNAALVWLTARQDAQPWAGKIQVRGKATLGDRALERVASSGTVVWRVGDYNNEPVQARESPVLTACVSAHEPAPITIRPAEEKVWKAVAGSKLEIPLHVERRWEFNEKFNLKAVGLSGLDKLKEMEVDGQATHVTLVIDLKEHKLSPGRHLLALRGLTKGKYRNQPEAVDAAKSAVAEAGKKVALARESLTRAQATLAQAEEKEKGAAQQSVAAAEAALKEAEHLKKQRDDDVKKAEERAKPREVTITVYSSPIHLEIMPAAESGEESKKP